MKEPDHKVKRHIVPFSDKQKPYWIENPVHGWLGSGVTDCNGKEIFEGDRVRIYYVGREVCETVTFDYGCLYLDGEALVDFS
ncbi:MAG: hypothetical protein IKP64_13980, partial [Selenomonadaceae bacterium]|nr:hypothetical protein [Selenomonadaceae bacterium]